MKPEMRLIDLMRYASLGNKVCVIGESLPSTLVEVGRFRAGTIFFRNYDKSGLLMIRVDTIWFMEYPVPAEVERLCFHMTHLSMSPRIIKGNE
jgi:hypothetical protein